jgi:Mg/Co/Ni transporter MgtE
MPVETALWLQLVTSSPEKAIEVFKKHPAMQAKLLADLLTSPDVSSQQKAQFLQHESGFLLGSKRDFKTEEISQALSMALQKCLTKKDTDRINTAFANLNLSTQIRLLLLATEKDNLSPQDKNNFFDAVPEAQQEQILHEMAKKPLKDQVNFLLAMDNNNQQKFINQLSSQQQLKLFQEKDLNLRTKANIFPTLKTNAQIGIITNESISQADKLNFIHKLDGAAKNNFFSRMANTSEAKQQQLFNSLNLDLQTEYLAHKSENVKIGPLSFNQKPICETTIGQNLFKKITGDENISATEKQVVLIYQLDPKGKSSAVNKLFNCLSNTQKADFLNYAYTNSHQDKNLIEPANNLFNSLSLKQQRNLLLNSDLAADVKGELFKQLEPTQKKELLTGFFNGFNNVQREKFFNGLENPEHRAIVLNTLSEDYVKAKNLLLNVANTEISQLKKDLSTAKTDSEKKLINTKLEDVILFD